MDFIDSTPQQVDAGLAAKLNWQSCLTKIQWEKESGVPAKKSGGKKLESPWPSPLLRSGQLPSRENNLT